MALQHVHVECDFAKPVERVFAYLAEHEHLGAIFPARVERVRDGEQVRNGTGSRRRLSLGGLLPFEETVTEYVENERIEYRITKGSPMRNHKGVMVFSTRPDGGSHLDYRIVFSSPVPGIAPAVRRVLTRSIGSGLAKVEKLA